MARNDGINLLPDDADGIDDTSDFDLANLTIDFTDKEAESEARLFTAIPTGAYHVKVTNVEVKRSTSGKNPGKPYYALTLNVQDGQFAGRKLWANVMLWSGAGFTLAQIMKAMNRPVGKGVLVPRPDELMGHDFIVLVAKVVDKYQIEQGNWDGEGPKPTKNDVKGFKRWNGDELEKIPGQAGGGSLLP
jgi:hypothetical protein